MLEYILRLCLMGKSSKINDFAKQCEGSEQCEI